MTTLAGSSWSNPAARGCSGRGGRWAGLCGAVSSARSPTPMPARLGEVLVEDGQCDVGQGRDDAPLGRARDRVPFHPVLGEDAGFEECLHQARDALVSDPTSHSVHEGRVVDLVEAGLDVSFEHPLVVARAGGEVDDLGVVQCTTAMRRSRPRIAALARGPLAARSDGPPGAPRVGALFFSGREPAGGLRWRRELSGGAAPGRACHSV